MLLAWEYKISLYVIGMGVIDKMVAFSIDFRHGKVWSVCVYVWEVIKYKQIVMLTFIV